jgi:hypothetical protein
LFFVELGVEDDIACAADRAILRSGFGLAILKKEKSLAKVDFPSFLLW